MAPKPRPPPSPSSSASSSSASESASSSSDDQEMPLQKPSQPAPSPAKKPPANPKNPPPPPPPAPATASSVSGSGDASEDGSDSDSPPAAASAKPEQPTPTAAASESGDSSGAESSDTEVPLPLPPPPPRRPSRAADPSIKPIASKPMDAKPLPATPEKRKRADAAPEDATPAGNGPSAKKLFSRVWSPEDEIAVLEAMVQFQAKRGGDPTVAIDAFYEFVRRSLTVEFSKSQIADKVRRMKKKYQVCLRRGKKGADPTFTRIHDQTAFELSKKIWSTKEAAAAAPPPPSSGEEDVHSEAEELKKTPQKARPAGKKTPAPAPAYANLKEAIDLLEKDGGSSLVAGSLARAVELLKPAKAKAMEERWGRHFIAGAKLMLERAELKKDLLKALVESLENISA